MSEQQTTSRGRVIKKPGMDEKKLSALDKIREINAGNLKRTD